MIIYNSDGTPFMGIKVDDASYRYEEIMGGDYIHLEFSLAQHVELEPGMYVLFGSRKYVLMTRSGVTIRHGRDFEYKASFEGPQARFNKYVYYNYIDGRVKFDMVGTPLDHLTHIVANLNMREPGVWSVGDYISDVPEQLVSYSHNKVGDALNMVAEAFGTEWEVVPSGAGYAINLKKVEYDKANPLPLAYGKNAGFKPGVGRLNYGDNGQVGKVYIEGSDRNLSVADYGASTLHFPVSLEFLFDINDKLSYVVGGVRKTEQGFDAGNCLPFVTDQYGASVRLNFPVVEGNEASLDLTAIYPSRVGTVSGVFYVYKGQYLTYSELVEQYPSLTEEDWASVQVDIVDSSIGASLDYSQCLMGSGEPLLVTFQTGRLVGRAFDATFVKEAKTKTVVDPETHQETVVVVRPANRFELVRTNIDGADMPAGAFLPLAGDTYIVTDCVMPDGYIRDFDNFSGAEIDALREACRYIRENKDPQFTFKGEVDGLYAMRNWVDISDRLKPGGYISFQHPDVQPSAVSTRIVAMRTHVNSPYCPEITLSNETQRAGMSATIAKLTGQEAHVEERAKEAERFTKRSFRDAKETIGMLQGALDYFSSGITPITVETMSMLVGDEALQFRFWTNRSCTTPVPNPVAYDADTHSVVVAQCAIQHMTLGLTDIKPSTARSVDEYKRWSMSGREFDLSADGLADKAYYLYAKVDALNDGTAHTTGRFILSETKKGMDEETGYYHLLVGIVNSEYDNSRSFAPMFGFTEVLPGQITTDVIRSSNGQSYFDLQNNQFALGNALSFIDNVLTLRGSLVVTGNGDAAEIGAWCGEWSSSRQYAKGDEVWRAGSDGTVSTYRYIYGTPSTGNDPRDGLPYWEVNAAGVKGEDGESPVFADMDNEMGGIVLPDTGVAPSAVSFVTYCKMWHGTTQITLSSISYSTLPSGFSITKSTSTGRVTIKIAAGTAVPEKTDITITVTGSYGGATYSRDLVFTVNGVRNGSAGAKGDDAVVYSLLPSVSSVKKDKENIYSVPNVSCQQMKKVGTNAIATSADCTMKYQLDGGQEQPYTAGTGIPTANFSTSVTFLLYYGETLIDKETVPLVVDGTNGTNGSNGYNQATLMLYRRSASPISAVDWDDTLTFTFASNTLNPIPSGWSRSIPSGTDPIYVTAASATSRDASVSIEAGRWATPVLMAENGGGLQTQWSADGTSWHDTYTAGDIYMRQRIGDGAWGAAIRAVGESGDNIYVSFAFKAAESQPATPSDVTPIPAGWSDEPPGGLESAAALTFDETFDTTGDTPHIISPGHGNQEWGRVTFHANAGDRVTVHVRASSEARYDFGYVTPLDPEYISIDSCIVEISGVEEADAVFEIPTTGEHFFFIGYKKDGSRDVNDDTIYVDSAVVFVKTPVWFTKSTVTNGVSNGDWSEPRMLTGTDGRDGTNGTNGLNTATVVLYQRGSSALGEGVAPAKPTEPLIYTFATGILTDEIYDIAGLAGWSQAIPASNGYPCYSIQAVAISSDAEDTIGEDEWSDAQNVVEDGTSGYNQATIMLYRRSESVISAVDWATALVFRFSDNSLTPIPTNWSRDIPSGDAPVYATAVSVSSRDDEVSIPANRWAEPVKMVENGTNGLNTALVVLYKRADSTPSGTGAKPSGTTRYTFSSGDLSIVSTGTMQGWTRNVPSGTAPCYRIQAVAISADGYDDIASGEWSSPVKVFEDGASGNGISSVAVYYGVSATSDMPSSWVLDDGTGSSVPQVGPGTWIWVKTVTTYSDGSTNTSYSKSLSGGTGPASLFRGEYNANIGYYGSLQRTDIVRHNGLYYRANPLAASYESPAQGSPFMGIEPGDATYGQDYWLPFQGQFDSLATGLAFIERLVVQRLNTAGEGGNSGKRIVVEGNKLFMYDGVDNINPKMLISGDDLSEFPTPSYFNFSVDQKAVDYQNDDYAGDGYVEGKSSGVTFSANNGGVLNVPDIGIDLNASLDHYSGNQAGDISFDIGWEVDGEYITGEHYEGRYGRVGSYSNKSYSEYVVFPGFALPLSAGQHVIKLTAEVWFGGCSDCGENTVFVCSAVPRTTNQMSVTYAQQRTEIGANGFQVSFGQEQLFKCIVSGSVTTFLMQSNNVGIELTSSGSGGTLRIRLGGTWYTASRNGSGYLVLT